MNDMNENSYITKMKQDGLIRVYDLTILRIASFISGCILPLLLYELADYSVYVRLLVGIIIVVILVFLPFGINALWNNISKTMKGKTVSFSQHFSGEEKVREEMEEMEMKYLFSIHGWYLCRFVEGCIAGILITGSLIIFSMNLLLYEKIIGVFVFIIYPIGLFKCIFIYEKRKKKRKKTV